MAQLKFEEQPAPPPAPVEAAPAPPVHAKRGKAKPVVPAWEDVLLGVRSSGER